MIGAPRKAAWCAVDERGELTEGTIPADGDGLARLVHTLGPEVGGCVEMMSGAVWVREQLRACGWEFAIADAPKVKAIAPLACKTDRVDARVLAQLARRFRANAVALVSASGSPSRRTHLWHRWLSAPLGGRLAVAAGGARVFRRTAWTTARCRWRTSSPQ